MFTSDPTFSVLTLSRNNWLYFEKVADSLIFDASRLHLIAAGHGSRPKATHESFVRELVSSNGASFNTGIMSGPPTYIWSPFSEKMLLEPVMAMADAFNRKEFCEEACEIIARSEGRSSGDHDDNDHDDEGDDGALPKVLMTDIVVVPAQSA